MPSHDRMVGRTPWSAAGAPVGLRRFHDIFVLFARVCGINREGVVSGEEISSRILALAGFFQAGQIIEPGTIQIDSICRRFGK